MTPLMLTAYSTQESESFDLVGWISLVSVCLLWQGPHKSQCINTSVAEAGDIEQDLLLTLWVRITCRVWGQTQGEGVTVI